MEATMDAVGRVLIPQALRTNLGLQPGDKLDISVYGTGLQITPAAEVAVWFARTAVWLSPATAW